LRIAFGFLAISRSPLLIKFTGCSLTTTGSPGAGLRLRGLPLGAEASPIIISETGSHIVVAVEIAKTTLHRHRRFLETLLQAAIPPAVEDDE
jgi:hypothetical protein